MKNILTILLLSVCSLLGQAFTHLDPTWPFAYIPAAAGGSGGSTTNLGDGLLDYFTMDNTRTADKYLDGVYMRESLVGANGPTNVVGVSSNGVYFNGAANSISYASRITNGVPNPNLSSTNYSSGGTNSFTISAWLKIGRETGLNTILGIWQTGGGSPGQKYKLAYDSGGTYLGFFANMTTGTNSGIGFVKLFSTGSTWTNQWIHVALGYDGQIPALWFQTNGGARVTQPIASVIPLFQSATNTGSPYNYFGIGNLIDGSYGYLGGVDEMAYWNRTLSTNDVALLYGNGSPLVYSSSTWTNNWQYKWP